MYMYMYISLSIYLSIETTLLGNSTRTFTHEDNNPVRVITSGCGTPTENLSLFIEKCCKTAINSIPCRVRDTSHMLDIIEDLNEIWVFDSDILVLISLICFHR